ncbi:rhodanese-like domain-containing protein [Bdellovibrio bacteriovorus]
MAFNSIGYFQFNNLLQNRIPMILVMINEEFDFKSWFNSLVNMHVENIRMVLQPQEVVAAINEKKLPMHFAVVVIDKDGNQSAKVVEDLEAAGYTNAFYVDGGYAKILTERQQ